MTSPKSFKVLIIGQGGREHALVYALTHSESIQEIHVIPGSDGMANQALCHKISTTDSQAIIEFCISTQIDFVIIGPEEPLVQGLSDQLRERGILVFGPSKDAAQLEASKVFAKKFMVNASIPTASFAIVTNVAETLSAAENFSAPFVLKADGLAAGKGVFICKDITELKTNAKALFEEQILGEAGRIALLEEHLTGWELSYLILTEGHAFQSLPLAQDHKRLKDNDEGPNTGGMGTIAPLEIESSLRLKIEKEIIEPTIKNLSENNILYRGVLFLGLMITERGPYLLEYNCRFGDPETQVILPLIENDLGKLFYDLSLGKLNPVKQKKLFSTCVVMAAPGYPMAPKKELLIEGDVFTESANNYFLHAGTKKNQLGQWQTNGGRILNAIGIGSSAQESIQHAYEQTHYVKWTGLQMRTDIGQKIKSSNEG